MTLNWCCRRGGGGPLRRAVGSSAGTPVGRCGPSLRWRRWWRWVRVGRRWCWRRRWLGAGSLSSDRTRPQLHWRCWRWAPFAPSPSASAAPDTRAGQRRSGLLALPPICHIYIYSPKPPHIPVRAPAAALVYECHQIARDLWRYIASHHRERETRRGQSKKQRRRAAPAEQPKPP